MARGKGGADGAAADAGVFAGRRVLVVGDAILDRYWLGKVARISREAPVPVVCRGEEMLRCGGAANTAANLAALGAGAVLLAVRGADRDGGLLGRCCDEAGVAAEFVDAGASTVAKLRILSQGQQLLRVDNDVSQEQVAGEIAARAADMVERFDAIVLSDYAFGTLGEARRIIAQANAAQVPVVVDPRGGWDRYRGADLVCPNMEELESAGGNAQQLLRKHRLGAILLTRGVAGMRLHRPGRRALDLPTRKVPVFDVTGAGDTVAAVMALGAAAGLGLERSAELANLAAGKVVGMLGTATVSADELSGQDATGGARILAAAQLPGYAAQARSRGLKVVMTNGCFDLLHVGHLDNLRRAARFGDILVVAVNDDDSVRQLKGAGRPVVPCAQRMELLAGLSCVDCVAPFSGRDAVRLVAAVSPDCYVKGGNWEGGDPPEAAVVRQAGGKVEYTTMRETQSTTALVARARGRGGHGD